MFLSIIIPVYNAEKYIRKCVQSLIPLPGFLGIKDNQMEVILVDDGSKDDSGNICDELCDENYLFSVKVLHQKNQGVSAARNSGLSVAKGEWVWFIDADDYIEIPVEKNTSVLFGEENFVVTGFIWDEKGKSTSFGASNGEIPYNLWRCWFRRDIVMKHDVFFVLGRKYAEDQEFILKYLINLDNLYSIPLAEIHYHYTLRPGSAMTKKGCKNKQIKDLINVVFSITFIAIKKNILFKSWVLKELKRILKSIIITLIR